MGARSEWRRVSRGRKTAAGVPGCGGGRLSGIICWLRYCAGVPPALPSCLPMSTACTRANQRDPRQHRQLVEQGCNRHTLVEQLDGGAMQSSGCACLGWGLGREHATRSPAIMRAHDSTIENMLNCREYVCGVSAVSSTAPSSSFGLVCVLPRPDDEPTAAAAAGQRLSSHIHSTSHVTTGLV